MGIWKGKSKFTFYIKNNQSINRLLFFFLEIEPTTGFRISNGVMDRQTATVILDQWKVIAQITNKPLFMAEIAAGVKRLLQTHKHQLVPLCLFFFHGICEARQYHRDFLRDEILHDTATVPLSLTAF